jgi:hypothetical protein
MTVFAPLVLLIGLTQAPSSTATVPDLAALTLDELIAQLPTVGTEFAWNRETKKIEYAPAVEEFERRLLAGVAPTDGQWRNALVRSGAIRWHEKWPATEPFALSMQVPKWLDGCALRLTWEHSGSAKGGTLFPSWCGTCSSGQERRGLYQELAPLSVGAHHLDFQVEIEKSKTRGLFPKADRPARIVWRGSLALDVEVVPTIDAAMPPVTGTEMDRAVRESLGVSFSDWADGRSAILVLDPDYSVHPMLATTALSLQIEVMRGDEVLETKQLRASDYDRTALSISVSKARARSVAFASSPAIPPDLEEDSSPREGWHLRVTGKSDGVLRNWAANRRFGGQFDLPLDEAIRTDRERAGTKGRGPWAWIPGPR